MVRPFACSTIQIDTRTAGCQHRLTSDCSATPIPIPGSRSGISGSRRLPDKDKRIVAPVTMPFYRRNVKWLRMAMVCAVAVLWLPTSSHALLEQIGWIHEASHHHDHHGVDDGEHHHDSESDGESKDHDAADGICRVESSLVDVPSAAAGQVLFFIEVPAHCGVDRLTDEPGFTGPSPPGTAPPELQATWQFSYRAAVPVRAPSLFS